MVSVSRRGGTAAPRDTRALTKCATSASGEPPLPLICTSSGSTTGRFSSRSGTMPHGGQ